MNAPPIATPEDMIKTLEKTKIYIMSELDDRAFAEYTTKATSFQIGIPVQVVAHKIYKYIVEENNDNKNIINFKDYAKLTVAFAEKHPDYFTGKTAQGMLKELQDFVAKTITTKRNIVPIGNYNKPQSLLMPNTKLSNFLFDMSRNLTQLTALIVNNEKEPEITVTTQLSFIPLDMENVKVPEYLTAYDRAVHDAICSIYASGNMLMTSNQIYEAMTGKRTKSSRILKKIDNSVMALMQSLVFLDYTNQAKSRGLDCKKTIVTKNIIYCEGVTVTFPNGERNTGWQLIKPPVLYEYGKNIGQIVTVEKAVLSAPDVTNTDDVVVLKHYLIRRIEAMKNTKNHMDSNKILFNTMFSYCNITGNREKLRMKRDIVISILKDWQSIGYIKNYKEYRGDKNKILGVEITP